MGLLWLTIRTFDSCFDRISDRPWGVSVRTISLQTLIGMIGAGSLLGGVSTWIEGFEVPEHDSPNSIGILAYSFFLAIGLVLLAVESAVSGRQLATTIPIGDSAGLAARRFIRGRWWASFRLVLLLAIGPAVLALALSTATWKPTYHAKSSNPPGSKTPVVTYELIKEHIPLADEVNLGERLIGAGLWILTILAHGAAAIGAGLALTTVKAWSRRAVLAAIVVPLSLLILPLGLFMITDHYDYELITSTWSFVVASNSLLDLLISRRSFSAEDVFRCVLLWDVVMALSTFGLLSWTARAWQRRLLSVCSETASRGRQPPGLSGSGQGADAPRSPGANFLEQSLSPSRRNRISVFDAAEGHPIVETALVGPLHPPLTTEHWTHLF
jgi:hypothetical protein